MSELINRARILKAITPYLDRGERFNGTSIALDLNIGQGCFVACLDRLIQDKIIMRVRRGHYAWHERPHGVAASIPEPETPPKIRTPNLAPGITLAQAMGRR